MYESVNKDHPIKLTTKTFLFTSEMSLVFLLSTSDLILLEHLKR